MDFLRITLKDGSSLELKGSSSITMAQVFNALNEAGLLSGEAEQVPIHRDTEPPVKLFFIRGRRGADAKGRPYGRGFKVLGGSALAHERTKSAQPNIMELRAKLKNKGIIQEVNGRVVLTQDYLFNSPSHAASFVIFSSNNGWAEWQDKDGRTLKDVEGRED